MAFNVLRGQPANTSTSAPAQAPAPVKEVVAEPAKPAAASVASFRSGGGLIIPGLSTKSVLAVISKTSEGSGGSGEMFPTLIQKGGNAGGTMAPSGLTPKEIADALPQGRQPIKGIFMAFRSEAIAWPVDFEQRKDGDRPTLSCAIPPTDGVLTELLRTGCENFQFCPRDAKATKWGAAAGGPGYLRPTMQMLVYLPQFDDPVVVQTAPLLESWSRQGAELAKYQSADGELGQFPCELVPVSTPWYDDNLAHHLEVKPWTGPAAEEGAKKYDAFIGAVQAQRPDLAQSVNDWFAGADKPISDACRAKLTQAANMTNPRKRRG